MKFDAIVGNPPYQDTYGSGGTNDASIYQYFIQAGLRLLPNYLSMIIPSRWFSGGREGLIDEFRKDMLNNRSIKKMFVYPASTDVFASVEIKGGICYFLIESNYTGDCEYSLFDKNQVTKVYRALNEFEVLIRNPIVAGIVKTVWTNKIQDDVSSLVSGDTPFGIPTNPVASKKRAFPISSKKDKSHTTSLIYLENHSRKVAYIDRTHIQKNAKDIDKYKVFIPKASGSGNDPYVVGKPEFAFPDSVCSQTFLYVAFDTEVETRNFISYLETKFFRVLVSASKISQDLPSKCYRFVPIVDFNKAWNDSELYKLFGLSDEEINNIEAMIEPLNTQILSE